MKKKRKKNWSFPKKKKMLMDTMTYDRYMDCETPEEYAKEAGCSIEKAEEIYEAIRSGNYVWSKKQLDNE